VLDWQANISCLKRFEYEGKLYCQYFIYIHNSKNKICWYEGLPTEKTSAFVRRDSPSVRLIVTGRRETNNFLSRLKTKGGSARKMRRKRELSIFARVCCWWHFLSFFPFFFFDEWRPTKVIKAEQLLTEALQLVHTSTEIFILSLFSPDGNFFIRNDEDGLDLLLGRCHSERQHGELFSFYFHSFTQIHCHSFTKIGKYSFFLISGNNPSFHVFSFKCWLQRKIEYYLRLNSSIILSFSNWQVSGYFLCKFCIEKCSNMMNENAVKKSYIFFTSWFFVSQIIKILWSYGKQGKCKSATFTNYQIYGKDFFLCLTLMRFKEKRIFPAR